jgi:hypothetical protein
VCAVLVTIMHVIHHVLPHLAGATLAIGLAVHSARAVRKPRQPSVAHSTPEYSHKPARTSSNGAAQLLRAASTVPAVAHSSWGVLGRVHQVLLLACFLGASMTLMTEVSSYFLASTAAAAVSVAASWYYTVSQACTWQQLPGCDALLSMESDLHLHILLCLRGMRHSNYLVGGSTSARVCCSVPAAPATGGTHHRGCLHWVAAGAHQAWRSSQAKGRGAGHSAGSCRHLGQGGPAAAATTATAAAAAAAATAGCMRALAMAVSCIKPDMGSIGVPCIVH